jgi:hypothetical protein
MSTRVFLQEPSQISSGGGTATITDSDDKSWVIEKLQLTENAQNDLSGATGTISIGGNSVTDQSADLATFQEGYSDLPDLGLVWPSNNQFQLDVTNDSGSNINIEVTLWVRPATDSEVQRGGGAIVRE